MQVHINIKNPGFIFAGSLLLFLTIHFISDFHLYNDLAPGDESYYVQIGTTFFHNPNHEWGRSYNFWYYLVHLINPDSTQVLFLSFKIMLVATAVLLFIFFCLRQVPVYISFALAFLYSISLLNIIAIPWVSHFCNMLIISCMVTLQLTNKTFTKILVLSFFSLLLAYARPEYFLAFFLSLLLLSSYVLKLVIRKEFLSSLRANVFPFLIYSALFTGVLFLFDMPQLTTANIDRGYIALVQHHILNPLLYHRDITVSSYDIWTKEIPRMFGPKRTLFAAICYNPLLVVKQVIANFAVYILLMTKAVESFIFPSQFSNFLGKGIHPVFLASSVTIMRASHSVCKKYFSRFIKTNCFFLAAFTIFFLPACFTNFVIGFQLHYILLHYFLLFILLVIYLQPWLSKFQLKVKWTLYAIAILSVLFFLFSPPLKKLSYNFYGYTHIEYNKNKKVIAYINKHLASGEHCMASFDLGLFNYVDSKKFHEFNIVVSGNWENKTVQENFMTNKVDLILVDDPMINYANKLKDISLKCIISEPGKFGFQKIRFAELNSYLLYKPV